MHLKNIESALILPLLLSYPTANVCAQVEKCDTVFLTVEQLFDRGTSQNLHLAADRLKEQMAEERRRTARTSRLPDISIGLKGGILGQPVVFQKGLSSPTYPETPDWQQNYAVDVTQPIYEGGRIRYSIKQADMEKDIAVLQTASDRADIKLALLNSYLSLFTLYSQRRVLTRNIEESERRLTDIRHMKKEGLITNNDVLRSEMQLTDNRLVLEETCNDIRIASQRLDVLLGMEENLIILPDSSLLDQTCSVSTYDEYVSMAYTSDPSMLLLQKQTELADNEIRLAKAEMLPKNVTYGFERTGTTYHTYNGRHVQQQLEHSTVNHISTVVHLQVTAPHKGSQTQPESHGQRRRAEAPEHTHRRERSDAETQRGSEAY